MADTTMSLTAQEVLDYVASKEEWTVSDIVSKTGITPAEAKKIVQDPEFIRQYSERLKMSLRSFLPKIVKQLMARLEMDDANAAMFRLALQISTDWLDKDHPADDKPPMTAEQYADAEKKYQVALLHEAENAAKMKNQPHKTTIPTKSTKDEEVPE